jgi:hypothetical protein
MQIKHLKGQISETILTEYFLRHKFYVFRPISAFGPVDLVVVSSITGKTYAIDAKTESFRVIKGRNGKHRINRTLSKEQEKMGVRIAYISIDTREVNITPPIPELVEKGVAAPKKGVAAPKTKKT